MHESGRAGQERHYTKHNTQEGSISMQSERARAICYRKICPRPSEVYVPGSLESSIRGCCQKNDSIDYYLSER